MKSSIMLIIYINKGAYVGVPGSPLLLIQGGLSSRLPTVGEVNLSHLPTTHLTRCEADLHRKTPNV